MASMYSKKSAVGKEADMCQASVIRSAVAAAMQASVSMERPARQHPTAQKMVQLQQGTCTDQWRCSPAVPVRLVPTAQAHACGQSGNHCCDCWVLSSAPCRPPPAVLEVQVHVLHTSPCDAKCCSMLPAGACSPTYERLCLGCRGCIHQRHCIIQRLPDIAGRAVDA